jgi:hypothetical protein
LCPLTGHCLVRAVWRIALSVRGATPTMDVSPEILDARCASKVR